MGQDSSEGPYRPAVTHRFVIETPQNAIANLHPVQAARDTNGARGDVNDAIATCLPPSAPAVRPPLARAGKLDPHFCTLLITSARFTNHL